MGSTVHISHLKPVLNRPMKKILITLSVLLVVTAAAVFLYLRNRQLTDFEPYFKRRLDELVVKASGGLYHLSIGKLDANVVSSKITLVDAHLYPDTALYARLEKLRLAPNDLFEVSVHQLAVNGLTPAAFMQSKMIDVGRLFIDNPVVKVWHKKQPYNLPGGDSSKTVYQLIQKDVSRIWIDTIMLNNVDFSYTNKNKQNRLTRLSNIKLLFSDVLVDSTTQYDRQRFFFAKNGLISLKDYTVKTGDSLYRLSIADISIQTQAKEVQLSQLQYRSRLSVKDFYHRVKISQDKYEVSIGEISLFDIDWWNIVAEESLVIRKINMKNGVIKIYKDRILPGEGSSKLGKYPHQLLMKSPLQLSIDSTGIQNFDLAYTERNPKSGMEGTVRFNNMNATIDHLTNLPEAVKKNAFCRIRARALFMKKSPLTAEFVFDLLHASSGKFTLNASLGAIDATSLNDITIPLGLVKINHLQVKRLDAAIKGNNYDAGGTIKLLYNDLNITVLKDAGDTVKKRGLLSFIANTFVLKKENPQPGKPARVEQVAYQRDVNKSFFNLVWKTIFTGAGKTVGYKVKK